LHDFASDTASDSSPHDLNVSDSMIISAKLVVIVKIK